VLLLASADHSDIELARPTNLNYINESPV
jgi:hypothetical protein